MPASSHPVTPTYRHAAGEEPLPGYRLRRPLGRGGAGEVWECVAPGGLLKAVKFVPAAHGLRDDGGHRREYEAFERVRAARHPFLLGFERVEWNDDELVMVTELADDTLDGRARQCRESGLPGIPRRELLGYLADAAEALDLLADRHGLQHLDVKPANLFLVQGRLKVGDFGLARRVGDGAPPLGCAITPRYAAPEVLEGGLSARADQYALAVVFQELLTGTRPFDSPWPRQLVLQHLGGEPDLSGLPPADRPAVARALSKEPDHRFRCCAEFVAELRRVDPGATEMTVADFSLDETAGGDPKPILLTRAPAPRRLADQPAVLPVGALGGGRTQPGRPWTAGELARVVAVWAVDPGGFPETPAHTVELPGGAWRSEFWAKGARADHDRAVAALQVAWGAALDRPDAATARFAVPARGAEPAATLELRLPMAGDGGLVTAVGRAESTAEASAWRVARLLDAARAAFLSGAHRRSSGRVLTDLRLTIMPIGPRGEVLPAVSGRCRDVSAGGARFIADTPVPGERAYLAFPDVTPVRDWAILTTVLRRTRTAPAQLLGGRYANC